MIEQVFMTLFVLFTIALIIAIGYVIIRNKKSMSERIVPVDHTPKTKAITQPKTEVVLDDPVVTVLKKSKRIPYDPTLSIPQIGNTASVSIGHVVLIFLITSMCLWLTVTFMSKASLIETALGVEAMAFMITTLDALMIVRKK